MGATVKTFHLETDFNIIFCSSTKISFGHMDFVHKVIRKYLRKYLMRHNLRQVVEPKCTSLNEIIKCDSCKIFNSTTYLLC